MKKQEGAALIIVLSLLTVSLMLGLSSMQASLVDERLAGNYRASTRAYMAAESAAAWFDSNAEKSAYLSGEEPESFITAPSWEDGVSTDELVTGWGFSQISSDADLKVVYLGALDGRPNEKRVAFFSRVFGAERVVYADYLPGAPSKERGIIACENITIGGVWGGGSARLDSYDSREGRYQSDRSRGDVAITTKKENSDVSFTGNGRIYGDVFSTGSVYFKGSTELYGDVMANGEVGFENWSAYVYGNSKAGSSYNTTSRENSSAHIEGALEESEGGAGVGSLETVEDCDSMDVKTIYNGYASLVESSGVMSITDWQVSEPSVISSEGFFDPHPNHSGEYVDVFNDGRESVVRLDSFKLGGSRNFQVGAVDNPVNMVMVVDGDFTIEGGTSFVVEEGSSLKLVVNGRFRLLSSRDIETRNESLVVEGEDGEVRPALSLISTYDDRGENNGNGDNAGVFVGEGESSFYGSILAPYSHVNFLNSSHLYGAVDSRRFSAEGNNGIHFDEALSEVSDGGSGGSEPWKLIGWQ